MADAVVFTIAGAKGGVGKTTTSINLCAVLAEQGRSVLLVELDVAMANVCDFLDLGVDIDAPSTTTLHDVLAGRASLRDATYSLADGFTVAPSGTTLEGFAGVDAARTASIVETARETYDIVVLDTGAGVGNETIAPLSLADETVLVSSPRVAAVRDTKKTRQLVEHVGGTVAGVLFVKSGSGRSPGVERIAEFLDVDLLGHVPEDPAVPNAQDSGRPVVSAAPESPAAKAYGAFGSRISERINAVQAERALREQEYTDDEATPVRDEEALSTDEAGGDGFTFVSEDDDVADDATDREQAATAEETESPSADGLTADKQSTTRPSEGVSTGTTEASTARSRPEQAARPTAANGDAATSRTNGASQSNALDGASDEDIAQQLAVFEAMDGDTGRSQSNADDEDSEDEAAESDPDHESIEEKESAAKRFIDRAIGMIDRSD